MRKLTITVDDDVYAGLYAQIGKGNISRFINDIARPHIIHDETAAGYEAMAADHGREEDAQAWAELGMSDWT